MSESQDPYQRLLDTLQPRYHFKQQIGEGGMAVVYLAEDARLGRDVAIKIIKVDPSLALRAERFKREIKLTARLNHPGIVPLFDAGDVEGLLYYVMPFVDGATLGHRMHMQGELPIDDAMKITLDVAAALAHAHHLRIVHRDVKPDNILLTSDRAVVSDFGIARALHEASGPRLTGPNVGIGTVGYMSPEQFTGERTVDGRSDLYSLAIVAFEMLAGEKPYTGPTARAIHTKQLKSRPPSVRLTRPNVPEIVDLALQRALSPVPADRFVSVEEFAASIRGERPSAALLLEAASEALPTPETTDLETGPDVQRGVSRLFHTRVFRRGAKALGLVVAVVAVAASVLTMLTNSIGSVELPNDRVVIRSLKDLSGQPVPADHEMILRSVFDNNLRLADITPLAVDSTKLASNPDSVSDGDVAISHESQFVVGVYSDSLSDMIALTVYSHEGSNITLSISSPVLDSSSTPSSDSALYSLAADALLRHLSTERQAAGFARTCRRVASRLTAAQGYTRQGDEKIGQARSVAGRLWLDYQQAEREYNLAMNQDQNCDAARIQLGWILIKKARFLERHHSDIVWASDSSIVADSISLWIDRAKQIARTVRASHVDIPGRLTASATELLGVSMFEEYVLRVHRDRDSIAAIESILLDAAKGRAGVESLLALSRLYYMFSEDEQEGLSVADPAAAIRAAKNIALTAQNLVAVRSQDPERVYIQVFWTGFDGRDLDIASKACEKREPELPAFAICRLWLMAVDPPEDASEALSYVEAERRSPTIYYRESLLVSARILAAFGDYDGAAAHIREADSLRQANPITTTFSWDLQAMEAWARIGIGQIEQPMGLLLEYVAANPYHRFYLADARWTPLVAHPRFCEIIQPGEKEACENLSERTRNVA